MEQNQSTYYAVIFTSKQTENLAGYAEMTEHMIELAKASQGFLGLESAREQVGITVSYWKDKESIKIWKQNVEHIAAQRLGKQQWYSWFKVRIAQVESEYEFESK